jgi:RimJ/RimL family protein N-acetyltransferase
MTISSVPRVNLIPIGERADAPDILYALLKERQPHQNINHKHMPTWDEHVAFVQSKPYSAWYLIEHNDAIVGSSCLTATNEIGVFIFSAFQGRFLGPAAVTLLMEKHPATRFLANINPANQSSITIFEKLGFRHIQNTYEFTQR